MGLIDRLFPRAADADAVAPLYDAIVAEARAPHWYVEGGVADSVDGRFDMVAAVLALVLLRLERDAGAARQSVWLTERFVADMDGQLREIGIGDMVVGKQVGRMMAMLGGRLGAYRDGIADGTLDAALSRNLWRGDPPAAAAVMHVREGLLALRTALAKTSLDDLAAGRLP